MTGAGGFSSDPQPVAETRSALSLFRVSQEYPPEEATESPARPQGRGVVQRRLRP